MFGGGGYGDNDDDDYDFDIEGVTKANQVVVKSNSRSIQKSLSNSRVGKEPSDALEKAKLMLSKYGSSKVALSTSVDNSMKYKQKTAAVALEDSDEEEEYFNHNKRKEESDEENESFESFMSSKSSQNDEIMQTNKQQREMKNKKNIHFYSSTYSENSDDRDSGFDDPYSNPPPMASHATSKEIQRNTSYDPSISASYIESVDSFVEESPAVTLPQSAGNKNFHVEEERNDEADDVEEDYEADDDFVEEADASNGSAMKRELSKEDENGENHDDDDTSVGAKPKVFSFAGEISCSSSIPWMNTLYWFV